MLGPNTAPSSTFHPYKLLRSRRTWVCPLALLLGLGGPWGAARAEGGVAYKPNSFSGLSLEELLDVKVATVVTASKHEQKATEAPATVIVITRSDIRLRGYRFLTDVLRDLPGMETIETYFSEFGTLVPVRGVAGNNKIVVLLNGVRVNPPGGESMMFRSDFSLLEAEQIEIIYGPGSTLYGQDAISAVINVITRKPDDTLLDATGAAGVPLRGEGAVSLHHKVGSGSVLAALSYENARLSDLTSQYPDEWARYNAVAAPKGTGTVPERWDRGLNVLLRAEIADSSVQLWERQSSRSSSEGLPYSFAKVPGAVWSDSSTVAEAHNLLHLTPQLDLESSLGYSRYEISPGTRYQFQTSEAAWYLNDFKYGLGSSGSIEEKLTARPLESLRLTVGLRAEDNRVIPKASIPGGVDTQRDIISQANQFTYYTTKGDPTSKVTVGGANLLEYQSLGAYAEAEWQALAQLKVVLGARLDRNTRFSDTPLSPRAAVIWSPMPKLTLKYIFTQAYVAPAPYASYNVYDDGVAINIPNTQLSPERATSNEFNGEWNQDNLKVGLSGYYNYQRNLLVVGDAKLPVNVVNPLVYLDLAGTQTRELTHTANSGTSTSLGADLYSKLKIWRVSAWASYSFMHVKTVTEGVASGLPGISAHQFRLGATVAVFDNFFVTPSLVLRSTPENLSSVGSLGDQVKWPYEFNLVIGLTPIKNLDLYLRFRNLTDHAYALSGVTLMAIPQETLSGTLGFGYSW
jgi:outer membrane receptor protein involved in Fe transport